MMLNLFNTLKKVKVIKCIFETALNKDDRKLVV